MGKQEWYEVKNVGQIDSPALLVYPERVTANIQKTIELAEGDTEKLRPHVKTNKISEVCNLMLQAGITKYKCATIAEAEMLALIEAPDVLLAYQPVGPKVIRLLNLVKAYPKTNFSCLVDHADSATAIQMVCSGENLILDVFLDLNVGMNRTGILPEKAIELVNHICGLSNLRLAGFHGYDGHIHDKDLAKRQQAADLAFGKVQKVRQAVQPQFAYPLTVVMGGTPTFPLHVRRSDCECSPGTFVFWDWGYKQILADLPYEYAALVVSRMISVIDDTHICIDLGYKAVAAESPLPRVTFLNAPEAHPSAQSEEHLVLEVPDSSKYTLGDVFYSVPKHICPTVALYDKAYIIENGGMTKMWSVIARNRMIRF